MLIVFHPSRNLAKNKMKKEEEDEGKEEEEREIRSRKCRQVSLISVENYISEYFSYFGDKKMNVTSKC